MVVLTSASLHARAYLPARWTPTNPDHGGWNIDGEYPSQYFDSGRLVFRLVTGGVHAIDNGDRLQNILHAFQTWEDVPTSRLTFVRGPDLDAAEATQRAGFTLAFTDDDNKTHWGQDMAGASGITLWSTVPQNGRDYMYDADICFSRNWATSDRMEATALHEIGHAIGFSHCPEAHSTLSYIGPIRPGHSGELARLSNGDRLGLSMTYPVPGFVEGRGAIGGTIKTSLGTDVHKAQIGVFDGDGILIITTLSDNGRYLAQGLLPGEYTLKVYPSQTTPTPVLHQPSASLPWRDLPATSFLALDGIGASVSAGTTANLNLTVQSGSPTMTTTRAFYGSGSGSYVPVVEPGDSLRAGVDGYGFPNSISDLANFEYTGDGIALSAPQVSFGRVTYQTEVSNTAAFGARGLTVEKAGGEKSIIFGFLEIRKSGSVSLSSGPFNPPSETIVAGFRHAMQQIRVSAGPEEPVRLRRWEFDTGGSGNPVAIAAVELYHDVDGDGQLGASDELIASGDHDNPTILLTQHTVASGASDDFIVVYGFGSPAPGTTFASSLSSLRANGVNSFRTFSTPGLPLAGNLHIVNAGGTFYTVTFTAGNGGRIDGASPQLVAAGEDTSAVLAVPNQGYQFAGWTGDVTATDNPLLLTNVQNNQAITANFSVIPGQEYLYRESFEAGLGEWIQAPVDDGDWTRQFGPTPSITTGPSAASDGNWYLFLESTSTGSPGWNGLAALGLPVDLDEIQAPELVFDYHMYGADMGLLSVQISADGQNWTTLWQEAGDQGNIWHSQDVDLSGYSGQVIVQFLGRTGVGGRSDMAIDNVILRQQGSGRALTTDGGSFSETAANLGELEGSVLFTLVGDTFTTDVISGGHMTLTGVPPGLSATGVRTSDTELSITLEGVAGNHDSADDTTFTVTFGNGAFTTGDAGSVSGASGTDLTIEFMDPYALQVDVPDPEVSEGSTPIKATVARVNGPFDIALTINLSSTDETALTVPQTVDMAPSETTVEFDIGVPDNVIVDGLRTVHVNAVAPGYASTSDAVDVIDDDFPITIESVGSGTTTPDGTVVVDADDSPFAISAVSGTGHFFDAWTILSGQGVIGNPTLPATTLTAGGPVTIQAAFAPNDVPLVVESFQVSDPTPIAEGYTDQREVDVMIQVAADSEATHWAVTETPGAPGPLEPGVWKPLGMGTYSIAGTPGEILLYAWLRNGEGEVNAAAVPASTAIILDFEYRQSIRIVGADLDELQFGQWAGATDGFDAGLDVYADTLRNARGTAQAYLHGGRLDTPDELAVDFRARHDPSWWRVIVSPDGGTVTLEWDSLPVDPGQMLWLQRLDLEVPVGPKYDLTMPGSLEVSKPSTFEITLGRAAELVVPVQPGWNLVGQPHSESVMGDRTPLDRTWLWDGQSTVPGDGTLPPGESGFWLWAEEGTTQTSFEGVAADGTVALDEGWNLIAVGVDAVCPAELAVVWEWDAVARRFCGVEAGSPLVAGKGYWVWVERPVIVQFQAQREGQAR